MTALYRFNTRRHTLKKSLIDVPAHFCYQQTSGMQDVGIADGRAYIFSLNVARVDKLVSECVLVESSSPNYLPSLSPTTVELAPCHRAKFAEICLQIPNSPCGAARVVCPTCRPGVENSRLSCRTLGGGPRFYAKPPTGALESASVDVEIGRCSHGTARVHIALPCPIPIPTPRFVAHGDDCATAVNE
jgi:hypothetical protein